MKKTLWVLCSMILLSLGVSSSAWAEYTAPIYGCNATNLKLTFKLPQVNNSGNYIIHRESANIVGTLLLGTTLGGNTLNYNSLGTMNNMGPCFMGFMSQEQDLLICIYNAAFVSTENIKAGGGGKKHHESASFYGLGIFYFDNTDLNPDSVWGYLSILCDNAVISEDGNGDVTEINTAACKLSGGLPDLTFIGAGEVGPGYTFTGTINCKMFPNVDFE
jgi:hypothetical protein